MQVLSLIIVICAAVASSSIDDLQGIREDGNREYHDSENYGAAAGWLIFVGVMGMVIEATIIIVRFLNFSFINQKFLIFGLSVSPYFYDTHHYACIWWSVLGPGLHLKGHSPNYFP